MFSHSMLIILELATLINVAYYLAPAPLSFLWPVGTCGFWDVNSKVRYGMIRSNDQMTDVGEVI
jgi:hypothetical protein